MSKKSTNNKMVRHSNAIWAILVVVVVGLVWFSFKAEPTKPSQRPTMKTHTPTKAKSASVTLAAPPYVPALEDLNTEIVGVATTPWVDSTRVGEALKFIWTLRNRTELQTPHDHAIFTLVQEYLSGKRPLRVGYQVVVAKGSNANAPSFGRLAHSCYLDQYAYGQIQAIDTLLALSMYHELLHAVDCLGMLERIYNQADPLDHEAPAYAAQARFFLALYHMRMIDNIGLSAMEPSDAGLLQTTVDSWQALSDGRFAEWYTSSLKSGSMQLPPETEISYGLFFIYILFYRMFPKLSAQC